LLSANHITVTENYWWETIQKGTNDVYYKTSINLTACNTAAVNTNCGTIDYNGTFFSCGGTLKLVLFDETTYTLVFQENHTYFPGNCTPDGHVYLRLRPALSKTTAQWDFYYMVSHSVPINYTASTVYSLYPYNSTCTTCGSTNYCLNDEQCIDYGCSSTCTCGVMNNIIQCTACATAMQYGPTCAACTCMSGTCSSGLSGTGKCSTCTKGYFGALCDKKCPADCKFGGTCIEGINGTGLCACNNGIKPICDDGNKIQLMWISALILFFVLFI